MFTFQLSYLSFQVISIYVGGGGGGGAHLYNPVSIFSDLKSKHVNNDQELVQSEPSPFEVFLVPSFCMDFILFFPILLRSAFVCVCVMFLQHDYGHFECDNLTNYCFVVMLLNIPVNSYCMIMSGPSPPIFWDFYPTLR